MCEMRENMVGKIITGETIKLSGIIKTESDEKDKKIQGIFVPYILVNSIVQKTKNNPSDYDQNIIKEMKSNPNIFYALVKSFCPTIYGHEIVKAGLILGMAGGSAKNLVD
jgi:DNA helicase MCM8